MQDMLQHVLMAFLYALGLLLTLLKVMGLLSQAGPALLCLALALAALTAGASSRRLMLVLGPAAGAAALLWLLFGGAGTVAEVLRAVALEMSGVKGALPMVALPVTVISALLLGAAAFFLTYRSAGGYPALVLTLVTVVLLWLGDRAEALWWLIPTAVASVTLLMLSPHPEVKATRVLPLAAAAVLLSFGGMALGGVAFAPMKDAADALRQRIYDLFFFTAPRDVFTLASEGYYPQGQGQLGGPAEPDENPVMVVITPEKTYLRGVIKNVYTGRQWLDDTRSKRYLWSASRWQEIRADVFDMARPQTTDLGHSMLLTPKRVIVRMLSDSASSVFVPQRIRQLTVQGDLVPYFNSGSEIFMTRNLTLSDVWTAEAVLLRAGDAGVRDLIAGCARAADPWWDEVSALYLGLPEHLEPQVYDVAYEAAAGATDPYEVALRVQSWLQQHYVYTLDAPEQPPELDFVSTFLLLEKQGYCTHFASAMTVLCRMLGLPARYVEGYVATPDETGQAIVTGKEGHAWTEVYFRGFGWLTFDATPISGNAVYAPPPDVPSSDPDESQPESSPTPEPSPEPTAQPSGAPEPSPSPSPTVAPGDAEEPQADDGDAIAPRSDFPWWLLLLAALAALTGRVLWMRPAAQAGRCKGEFDRWLVWTQALHEALEMHGFRRQMDETPRDFFARVDAAQTLPVPLAQQGEMETVMFYGHAVPEDKEIVRTRELLESVCFALPGGKRVLMALRRAFVPLRRRDFTAV